MTFDLRRLAIAINGFCTFLNLYSPQALLPELSREFGATAAQISTIMTASTLAVALTAPVTGALADVMGWRCAFLVLAAMTLMAAVAILFMLPRETRFVRSEGFAASGAQMLRHLRNPRLIATYAVGFGTLFNFIATFTYVSFHLA